MNKTLLFAHRFGIFIILVLLFLDCAPLTSGQILIQEDDAGNNDSALYIFPADLSCVSPGLFSLFHLQYSLTVSWNSSQIITPISNGETRTVNMSVYSTVNRGLFGGYLLRLLEGTPYTIHLSIEGTPEWAEPWFSAEDLTVVIHPGAVETSETVLSIHVQDDGPGNYTLGWVDICASVEPLTGPFHLCTLIQGFEQDFTVLFQNN